MKHFRLASQALLDLDDIWLFIAEDSPDNADTFIDLLFSKFLILAEHPMIGHSREDLIAEVLCFVVGNYVIFYRDKPEHVEIVRILHGARDIENLL